MSIAEIENEIIEEFELFGDVEFLRDPFSRRDHAGPSYLVDSEESSRVRDVARAGYV